MPTAPTKLSTSPGRPWNRDLATMKRRKHQNDTKQGRRGRICAEATWYGRRFCEGCRWCMSIYKNGRLFKNERLERAHPAP